ncbi:hypothetical protein V9W64_05915 [Neisseria leonii]|uniref:Uncharacterized protein n=1 Tax=Neisseria leonii TaxID=2995413 RepID=A0A9X4IEG1_9NEIS|nr:hypothetical protein [Neisseria sp. 51.81]MDD9328736.1 hypothetical protein [Neisseria sp. 51.81]
MKKLSNKEQAMYFARRIQKRMLIPKIFFISIVCILSVATIQEIVMQNNFLKKDIFLIMFTIYWVVGLLLCIVYIPIVSICPYCHSFQKMSGKSFGMDGSNLTYSKGISPFGKDYCTECEAPLSPKAVEHIYSQMPE